MSQYFLCGAQEVTEALTELHEVQQRGKTCWIAELFGINSTYLWDLCPQGSQELLSISGL